MGTLAWQEYGALAYQHCFREWAWAVYYNADRGACRRSFDVVISSTLDIASIGLWALRWAKDDNS